eukprot:5759816-Prymnesium_polylepis.1
MDLCAGMGPEQRSRLAREAKQFNHPQGGPLRRGGVGFVSEAVWANGFWFYLKCCVPHKGFNRKQSIDHKDKRRALTLFCDGRFHDRLHSMHPRFGKSTMAVEALLRIKLVITPMRAEDTVINSRTRRRLDRRA